MVDMDNLESQSKHIYIELGTKCEQCEKWITISVTTRSLDEAFEKLSRRTPGSTNYHYHFAKTLKKCEGIQEKYGAF